MPDRPGVGTAPPSPAGPLGDGEVLPQVPTAPGNRRRNVVWFNQRAVEFVFRHARLHGMPFGVNAFRGEAVFVGHPDHVRSLFTAPADKVPSITGESPLVPVVGPDSVLTAVGERHMRQRKLLLPLFHGEAVQQYAAMIERVTAGELERWRPGDEFALAPRMQSVTLDVIMAGIFGVEGRPKAGTPEHRLRVAISAIVGISTTAVAQVAEIVNLNRAEPVGLMKVAMAIVDRAVYGVIAARRRAGDADRRRDILSVLLEARAEDGERLTDLELRNELMTLVLAGHETTANQIAWTWERLMRTPAAHARLRDAVRGGDEDEARVVVEQTIWEGMRNRPVIPGVGRRVLVPWRFGDQMVPAGTQIAMSIIYMHHRGDLYPAPYNFAPERWEGIKKPGTYTWIPFGGGIRRCLGATLAMAEQRIVLRAMAERLDLEAVDPEPERIVHRNVTVIPRAGARARVAAVR